MFPYVTIFNKTVTSYAIMTSIGILVCLYYCIRVGKKQKIDDNILISIALIGALGAFIGMHLLYGLVNINLIKIVIKNIDKIDSFSTFINVIKLIFGGGVFYGGLFGGLLAAFIYCKKKKLDYKYYASILTPAIPLFHFFGRIGCFLSGCCYGIESKFGFIFHHSLIESANEVRRFPIQLVEALCNLILFIVLYKLRNNKKIKDYLLNIYLISYAIIRFILEFFRGDSYRGFIWGLSTSQFISILLIIVNIGYLILSYNKKKKA